MKKVCLLTGNPGLGKTSLIRQIAADSHRTVCIFYAEEIRNPDRRTGFRFFTPDAQTAALAHTGFFGSFRIGKYGVDLNALDQTGVPSLLQDTIVIADEIKNHPPERWVEEPLCQH